MSRPRPNVYIPPARRAENDGPGREAEFRNQPVNIRAEASPPARPNPGSGPGSASAKVRSEVDDIAKKLENLKLLAHVEERNGPQYGRMVVISVGREDI